jgi:hypothetical protein
MKAAFDQAGFEDSILNSYEDYEPYGFVSPQLIPVGATTHPASRDYGRDRVIESDLLAQCSMVGC